MICEAYFCEGLEGGANEIVIIGVGSIWLFEKGADITGASLVNAPQSYVGI